MQHGETSFWSHADQEGSGSSDDDAQGEASVSPLHGFLGGDPEHYDWAQNLPSTLNIDRATHDRILSHFGAYLANWCFFVDMTKFHRDMVICNTASDTDRRAKRTHFYSPLLHNTILYLGMYFGRREWSELMPQYRAVFMTHCIGLIVTESQSPVLSTVRALIILSTCVEGIGELC